MKGKIKVMNARPEISDQEITQSMDFEKLLVEKKKLELQLSRQRVRRSLLALSALVILSCAVYVIMFQPFNDSPTQVDTNAVENNSAIIQDSTAQPVDSDSSPEAQPQSPEDSEQTASKTPVVKKPNDINATTAKGDVPEQAASAENVYEQASPVDGYPALYEYFNTELEYPAENVADSIHGQVTVIFVIDVAGKPVNISVENSLGATFDEEAIRVVRSMPAWVPAKFNGKPVASKIRLPLTFETRKVKID